MSSLQSQLQALMASAPGARPMYLQVTDWFFDIPWEEIEPIKRQLCEEFRPHLQELIALLGEPARRLPRDREWFDQWYPEAIEAAAWILNDKVVCLAVDHHDKETPVALLIRCLTTSEVAGLSNWLSD